MSRQPIGKECPDRKTCEKCAASDTATLLARTPVSNAIKDVSSEKVLKRSPLLEEGKRFRTLSISV